MRRRTYSFCLAGSAGRSRGRTRWRWPSSYATRRGWPSKGLASASGEKQTDHLWALESLLLSADLSLQLGDLKRAEEALVAATQVADNAGPVTGQALVLRRLLGEANEQLRQRGRRFAELAALYEQRLASATETDGAAEAPRLREALVDLYGDLLGEPAKALAVLHTLSQTAPDDLRLWRRVVQLARRSGDKAAGGGGAADDRAGGAEAQPRGSPDVGSAAPGRATRQRRAGGRRSGGALRRSAQAAAG